VTEITAFHLPTFYLPGGTPVATHGYACVQHVQHTQVVKALEQVYGQATSERHVLWEDFHSETVKLLICLFITRRKWLHKFCCTCRVNSGWSDLKYSHHGP
jgi:hypothetical protein